MPASIIAKFLYSVNFRYSTFAIKTPAFPVIDLPGSNTIFRFNALISLEISAIKDSGSPGSSSL